MEREAWEENFLAAADGSIVLHSTRFRTFGAGVPDSAPQTRLEDGWVVMEGFARRVDPLVIRANAATEHRLMFGSTTYTLDPGQYRFTVQSPCS